MSSNSTENVKNKCYYCGNDNQETLEELGFDQKDTSFETDIFCKNCSTVFTTHYDCTQFRQADTDKLKEKYPQFAESFKANEDEKRKVPPTSQVNTQVKESQLPSTETNKNDVERANQVAQEQVKANQTNRPQQPDTQKPDNK